MGKTSTSWKKGEGGRPKGVENKVTQDAKALFMEIMEGQVPKVQQALEEVYNDDKESLTTVYNAYIKALNHDNWQQAAQAWNDKYKELQLKYKLVMKESLLNKTSTKERKESARNKKTATGKQSTKKHNIKRKKFASKISRCAEDGKTFSFKTMACVKTKNRR